MDDRQGGEDDRKPPARDHVLANNGSNGGDEAITVDLLATLGLQPETTAQAPLQYAWVAYHLMLPHPVEVKAELVRLQRQLFALDQRIDELLKRQLQASGMSSPLRMLPIGLAALPSAAQATYAEQGPEPFPERLHRLLEENNHLSHILAYSSDGKAFWIHNPELFMQLIAPRYFRQTKWPSFVRQLNLYGFSRQTEGPYRTAFLHPEFQRGVVDTLHRIRRVKKGGPRGELP